MSVFPGYKREGINFLSLDVGALSPPGWPENVQVPYFQQYNPPVQPNTLSVTQTFSSNATAVAPGSVLASFSDITPYTFFSISNTSGFSIQFNISLDGTNFFGVSMVDSTALTGDGTTVLTLATGKLYTRGIKGVQAQILAETAGSNIYALSVIQLSAGVGAP